jgi:hypothetical protein
MAFDAFDASACGMPASWFRVFEKKRFMESKTPGCEKKRKAKLIPSGFRMVKAEIACWASLLKMIFD